MKSFSPGDKIFILIYLLTLISPALLIMYVLPVNPIRQFNEAHFVLVISMLGVLMLFRLLAE